MGLMKNLKNKGNLQVQFLHCNNAGENQAYKQTCKQEGLGVAFEYTAPGMPQENGRVEQKFAPYSTKYALCSTAANSLHIYMSYGLKLQTPPCFSKTT